MSSTVAFHRRAWILVVVLGAAFVVFNGFLSIGLPTKFDSPDESANYLFIRSFATHASFILPSPLTVPGGIVAPRSMLAGEGTLLPASFLGMPLLYGTIARVLGMWVVPLLSSLITFVALLALYGLFARVFTRRVALVSSVLVALHPAVWYATVHGMFHNMLFVDCCIIGAYALVRGLGSRALSSKSWFALSGFSIGTAIAVRSSEVLWVGAVLLVALFAVRARTAFRRGWWVAVACGLVPIIIILAMNQHLYGHPLSFGYSGGVSTSSALVGVVSTVVDKVSALIFPFGFDPLRAMSHFYDYVVRLCWLPTLLSVLGLVSVFRTKGVTRVQKWFYAGTAVVSVWLVLFYGSWTVQDNPDPHAVSIGASYVRYWLPIYILMTPFAAIFLLRVRQVVLRGGRVWMLVALLAVWCTSALTVVFDPLEGVVTLRRAIASYGTLNERARALTPANALIVSTRGDKVFFPDRGVIMSVDTPDQLKQLRTLLVRVPVYVYVPSAESPITVSQEWASRGFSLTTEVTLAPYERLYLLKDGIDEGGVAEVQ